MIDNITIAEMENRFEDIKTIMKEVRKEHIAHKLYDGTLCIFFTRTVLCFECVDDVLMYCKADIDRWNTMLRSMDDMNMHCESFVGFSIANGWAVPADVSAATLFKIVSTRPYPERVRYEKEETSCNNVVLYELIDVVDALPRGEYGVSDSVHSYGIFTSLDNLRDAYVQIKKDIQADNAILEREEKHEFAIHAFVPDVWSRKPRLISTSFYLE